MRSGLRVFAAKQRQFQHPRHVEHRGVAPAERFARRGKLHAADNGVIDGIFRSDAAIDLAGDNHFVIEDLRHPAPLADDLRGGGQKLLRTPLVNPNRKVRLRQADIRLRPQAHVTQEIRRVAAIRKLTTDHEIEANRKSGEIAGAGTAAQ